MPRTRERPESTIAAADYGTLVHHWKETGQTDPWWAAQRDSDLLERKLLASGVRREDWWPNGTGTHEATYALNLVTLELRTPPPNVDRDEWKKQFYGDPEWLTGTIDWVGPGWLDDLKTGRWPVPPEAPQLSSYGLFLWVEDGGKGNWSTARSITTWTKYPLDGQPHRKWSAKPLTALDLEEHLDNLRYAISHPEEVNPTDEGCRFCDCRPSCPAWNLDV